MIPAKCFPFPVPSPYFDTSRDVSYRQLSQTAFDLVAVFFPGQFLSFNSTIEQEELAQGRLYSVVMPFSFPRIYPILDVSSIPEINRERFLNWLGEGLTEAGITLLEYRNKSGDETQLLADAGLLRRALPTGKVKLILDDRADLIEKLGFDGVHVDAGDVTPTDARWLLNPNHIVGTFGGSESLLPGILFEPVDYLSIGPVFESKTKQSARGPIGVEGVRKLREEAGTNPVLVAVGGITLEAAPAVLTAGATTVAVAAAIFRAEDPVAEFRHWMAELK
jgi:thiamine-phosphate pyrophosphorylase